MRFQNETRTLLLDLYADTDAIGFMTGIGTQKGIYILRAGVGADPEQPFSLLPSYVSVIRTSTTQGIQYHDRCFCWCGFFIGVSTAP